MLRVLVSREIGSSSYTGLSDWVAGCRIKTLNLSHHYDFEPAHKASINSCDIDLGEERYLLTGSGNGTISIHDLFYTSCYPRHTFKAVSRINNDHPQKHTYAVSTVQWYPEDTGIFTSSGMDKILKIWDTNESKVISHFTLPEHIYSHTMSNMSLLIAIGSDSDKVRLVDLKANSFTHLLTGHRKKAVMNLSWSPRNNFHLLSAGKDGKVILWDIRKARSCISLFDRHNVQSLASPDSLSTAHDGSVNGLCFLPDGNHFLSFGTDDCVRLWNVSTGKNMMCNYGRIVNKSKMKVTMSCDSRFAFVPCSENIAVLDIFRGCRISTLHGHLDQVNCCIYKSYQQDLVSGSKDKNLLFWTSNGETVKHFEDYLKNDTNSTGRITRPYGHDNPLHRDDWSDDDS